MRKYYEADELELILSGNDFFDVLDRIISESQKTLHIQTYILSPDETGLMVIDAIKRASSRGVRVFLLIDAYGSFPFPVDLVEEIREAGVSFRFYSPLFSGENKFWGRRLHHKIVVADKKVALIGGINIADRYNDATGEPAWLDYAVFVKGSVCEYLHLVSERFYRKLKPSLPDTWERKQSGRVNGASDLQKPAGYVRFRRNDWINRINEIYRSYIEALMKAEHSIVIVASYFLPGRMFRKRLKQAALRGVKIQIIMSGKSDVTSASFAQYYLYDFLLDSNIRLYEWTNSVMHGKAMIVDDTWVTIGSFNLNFLSHYASIELNADIIGEKFIEDFSSHLSEIISTSCTPITLGDRKIRKSAFSRLMMWLAYNFYRVLRTLALMGKKYRREVKQKSWTR